MKTILIILFTVGLFASVLPVKNQDEKRARKITEPSRLEKKIVFRGLWIRMTVDELTELVPDAPGRLLSSPDEVRGLKKIQFFASDSSIDMEGVSWINAWFFDDILYSLVITYDDSRLYQDRRRISLQAIAEKVSENYGIPKAWVIKPSVAGKEANQELGDVHIGITYGINVTLWVNDKKLTSEIENRRKKEREFRP